MLEALLADFNAPFQSVAVETVVVRLITAVVLGAAIGFEREYHAHSAGLRTHILISLAACLFTLIAFELINVEIAGAADQQTDPLRLIEAVTAGVAFLAAGSIITSGGQVHGLTTGAGMWLAGAIGLACGTGRIVLALIATGIALVVLWMLRTASSAIAARARTLGDGDGRPSTD
ncbi:MgtC/SapB family protein [Plastorhodobacter daqingensis]|uniref:Protein MgtC n=1 Tax=Plastorhodobacter daqingensis TaxID=1387281 RepID=A0ABW2UIU8_9RHOB